MRSTVRTVGAWMFEVDLSKVATRLMHNTDGNPRGVISEEEQLSAYLNTVVNSCLEDHLAGTGVRLVSGRLQIEGTVDAVGEPDP